VLDHVKCRFLVRVGRSERRHDTRPEPSRQRHLDSVLGDIGELADRTHRGTGTAEWPELPHTRGDEGALPVVPDRTGTGAEERVEHPGRRLPRHVDDEGVERLVSGQ